MPSCYAFPKGGLAGRIDADALTLPGNVLELDVPVYCGEEGEVPTQANVAPGMDTGAVLTHDDRSGPHELAVVSLDTEEEFMPPRG